MPSLSQALHLGDLPFPHSAFQDHATHTAGWPACLGPTAHGVPVYLKVLLHSSIMLHGAVWLPRYCTWGKIRLTHVLYSSRGASLPLSLLLLNCVAISMYPADISSKVCQGCASP